MVKQQQQQQQLPPNEDSNEPWSTMKILNQPPSTPNQQNSKDLPPHFQDAQALQQPPLPGIQDSSLSIYERLRHFLYINFVLNKRSFILSILSYVADITLFVSLNLYLFSNKKFIYELSCISSPTTLTTTSTLPTNAETTQIPLETKALNETESLLRSAQQQLVDASNNSQDVAQKTIKQSYLSLQIIILFVFFICFILSYLIKLQFKYHRLALNMYDYDVNNENHPHHQSPNACSPHQDGAMAKDRDGMASIASTTTGNSHFSSSAVNKKLSNLFKRWLNRLFTKLASILLNFFFGYQFCQNCFIQQWNEQADAHSIFIHFFILCAALVRCSIVFLHKTNASANNQMSHLKKLQEKQKSLFSGDPATIKSTNQYQYYYHYYSYLIKTNQTTSNRLKKHQNQQQTFRVFQLDDVALFLGFISALFHLFNFLKAFELVFVFLPLLFTLILFRFKSMCTALLNLTLIFLSILIISSSNSFSSITDISAYYLERKYEDDPTSSPIVAKLLSSTNSTGHEMSGSGLVDKVTTTATMSSSISDCNFNNYQNIQNSSSIIHLFSYNILTFFCFLLTFYLNALLSISQCALTAMERWNLAFLGQLSFWRKLSIYMSFLVYLIYIVTCTIAMCIKLKHWSLLLTLLPLYLFLSFVWCCFQLLNTINLTHLMNKINDCFLLLNESNSLSHEANSFENSSNHSKKSKSSQIYNNNNPVCSTASNPNRNSTLSQSSGNNNNGGAKSFKFKKFLQRFLSYDKLNMNDDEMHNAHQLNVSNVPIHRILAYKGVRHLGSISYRISLYCFVQTGLLAPFAFYTNSPITCGMYLCALSLNFVWLSLLYQFPKSSSGTCIAHAIVAPPLLLNIYNAGTTGTSSAGGSGGGGAGSTILTNSSMSASLSTKKSTTTTTTTTGNSMLFLPFNYQQAVTQRCTYLLNKMQLFLQFHLIENFGCEFAATGLSKEALEARLRSFFQKRSDGGLGAHYNTYILYYCGPTSLITDGIAFVDGNEFSLEQIVELWKSIHLNEEISFGGVDDDLEKVVVVADTNGNENDLVAGGSGGSDEEVKMNGQELKQQPDELKKKKSTKSTKKAKKNYNSRLIIIIDAENTSKSLNYVKTKLNEPNLYVALQTVKYNLNNAGQQQPGLIKNSKSRGFDNKLALMGGDKAFKTSTKQAPTLMMGPPGSPQTLYSGGNLFDSYLNFGKFTLDWIKTNCTAANIDTCNENDHINLQNQLEFINKNENFFYNNNEFDEEEENELMNKEMDDDDEEDDDEDDDDDESNDYDLEGVNENNPAKSKKSMTAATTNVLSVNRSSKPSNSSTQAATLFYEAKCAFSRHWIEFNFETKNEKALAHDFQQFWNLYYPYIICKPLLKLLNCRIFYLRFNFIRRIIFTLRHLKNRIIPIHEFETGHGFKIFNN